MVEVFESYNPEDSKVSISVKTALIKKYYLNLSGLIKKSKGVPKDTIIERVDEDVANIVFSIPKEFLSKKFDNDNNVIGIRVDREKVDCFYSAINRFINLALRKEFRSVEFLPIGDDYELDDLKKDVVDAIKNKRNFVVIHTYREYLDVRNNINGSNSIEFNQVYADYGTSLYSDIAILIEKDNLKELRELIEPMFKLTKWI